AAHAFAELHLVVAVRSVTEAPIVGEGRRRLHVERQERHVLADGACLEGGHEPAAEALATLLRVGDDGFHAPAALLLAVADRRQRPAAGVLQHERPRGSEPLLYVRLAEPGLRPG